MVSYAPIISNIIDMETLLIMIVYNTATTELERLVCISLIEDGRRFNSISIYL